jgi:hypothetical protein
MNQVKWLQASGTRHQVLHLTPDACCPLPYCLTILTNIIHKCNLFVMVVYTASVKISAKVIKSFSHIQ